MRRPRPKGGVRRFLSSTGANVATMAAIVAPLAISVGALAVDEASLYVERREAQSVTDLAAIAATQKIGEAEDVARATFSENGLEPDARIETGRYTPDASLPIGERFKVDAAPANAVRVTFSKTGRLYFAQAFSRRPEISTTAIATRRPVAAFSIGSRLARLDGGLLNQILGGLTGSQISLDAMDYDALLSSDIDLLTFFGPLATKLDLKATTYDELLDTKVDVSQIASALAAVDGLSARAVSALDAIARATARPSAGELALSDLVDLDAAGALPAGTGLGGLKAKVNALQMIAAAAAVADGDHQVHVDLAGGLPGLLSASLDLAIGEPPQHAAWFAVGDTGEIVRTAQTRLRLVVEIGGPGGLLGARVRVPLYLDLAYAEAKLASVTCPTGRDDGIAVAIDARPGIADLRIADMDASRLADFRNPIALEPAQLVKLPLVTVSAAAHAAIGNQTYTRLNFDRGDIDARRAQTVATRDFTGSLFASLLGDADIDVKIAGIDLGLSALLRGTVANLLETAAPAIDVLLGNVLNTLGISLGEADVTVTGATCGRAVLVQ